MTPLCKTMRLIAISTAVFFSITETLAVSSAFVSQNLFKREGTAHHYLTLSILEEKTARHKRSRDVRSRETRIFSSSMEDGHKRTKPSMLSNVFVRTLSNEHVLLSDVMGETTTTILSCLSHFGDFNAWELVQQYIAAIDAGEFKSDCKIVLVGIGSVKSANKFASDLDLPKYEDKMTLVTDETGSATKALGCYRGWLAVDEDHAVMWPATDVNPYIKLFGMIFGFGSPGTIQKVLYGYFGDKDGGVASRKWVVDALVAGGSKGRFPQISSKAFEGVDPNSGLRRFELATLRAQTGIHIVLNWSKLGPKDGNLFTRMGGTFVFQEQNCVYEYFDKGILTYVDMREVCDVINRAE